MPPLENAGSAEPPVVVVALHRLDGIMNRAEDYASQLEGIAARALGEMPPTGDGSVSQKVERQNCVQTAIDTQLDRLTDITNRIEVATGRLHRFV